MTQNSSVNPVENSDMLASLRKEIDALDEEILALLQKRAACSKAVAVAKNGTIAYRPDREKAIIDRLFEKNKDKVETPLTLEMLNIGNTNASCPLTKEHIQGIWNEIFSCSRSLQKPFSVAVLGPLGTFSHFASMEVFGQSAKCVACVDFTEVFEKVYEKDVFFGLVPLENSQQGSVGQCLDLLDTYPVKIVAEHYSSICQCLLSTETELDGIQEVFSHPQALMQSGAWLRKHLPKAKLTEMTSTAHAAQRALKEPHTAVIGHEKLSQLMVMPENAQAVDQNVQQNDINSEYSASYIYGSSTKGLHVLAKDIAKDKNNKTRFVLIAPKAEASVLRHPKTSLTFSLANKPGALSEILSLLQKHEINLSKLESRPLYQRLKQDAWQYRFFADANADLEKETEVLEALKELCYDFRILGVYENSFM